MSRDFEYLLVQEFKYWKIYLNENQCYLGRCIIWCKRDVVDFLDMNENEKKEFFEIASKLKSKLIKLFQPDLFNYNILGNEMPHLHIHFVPRYQTTRKFNNIKFSDKRWGKSPRPYEPEENISKETIEQIRLTIKEELTK